MEFEREQDNHPTLSSEVTPEAEPNGPMAFESWAARPAPRRDEERVGFFDFEALKIFLILAGLTAGMAFALRSLF